MVRLRLTVLPRRSFLQGLAVLAASLALDPLRYVIVDGRRYRNERLGVSATLPPEWEFGSIADFASLRERTELLDELEDELHPLKDPDNLPIFLFEQSRHRQGSFVPAIALYDEPLEQPPPRGDEVSGHALMLEGFGVSYRDLSVIRAPKPIELSGASATISTWSYTHDIDSESKELIVRSVVVFRGERVHTLHLVDSLTSPRVRGAVWEEFLRSVRYTRPSAV